VRRRVGFFVDLILAREGRLFGALGEL
jgi:hypothetical protein